jgi:hypothetical protein
VAAGFHVPSYLVETGAGGHRLVDWVRQIWGDAALPAPCPAQLALAGWIMADPPARSRAIEAAGLDIVDLLANRAPITPLTIADLCEITRGAVTLADWPRPYHASPDASPNQAPSGAGGGDLPGAGDTSTRATPPPTPSAITALDDAPGIAHAPIVHGRLGECAPGSRLFRCIRGEGQNRFILTGQGVALALDRASAADALECLADALEVQILDDPR